MTPDRGVAHRARDVWARVRPWALPAIQAVPYALALALGLGFAVVVGANLSNAMPSERHPWGFPGPSNFSNAVAMNRPAYILAASIPGLLAGLAALRDRGPSDTDAWAVLGIVGSHAALLWAGAWAAGLIGAEGAARSPPGSFATFVVAHALLANVFLALGVASVAVARSVGPAVASVAWIGYVGLYEHWTRWRMLREVGYPGLSAGQLPTWFFVAQALSPLTTYRALLVTWHPGFRDYEEKALLSQTTLPAWMTPLVLGLSLALWTLVLVTIAAGAWWLRGRGTVPGGPS